MVMEERAVSSGRAGERQEPRREQPTSTKCEGRGTRCSYCHFVNRTSYFVNLHDFSTTKRFIMAFPDVACGRPAPQKSPRSFHATHCQEGHLQCGLHRIGQ